MESQELSNLKSEEFLRCFLEKIGKHRNLDQFFVTTLNLISYYFSFSSSCLILEQFNWKKKLKLKLNSYYSSNQFFLSPSHIKTLQNITKYYHKLLNKDEYISLCSQDKNLPLEISLCLKEQNLGFVILIPIRCDNKYLGTLIGYSANYNYQLIPEDINLLKIVSSQYRLILNQLELEINLKKQKQINKKLEIQASKNQYILQMNHELRTPMTAIIGFAKMLKKQIYGKLNPKQMQYTQGIYEAGTYLLGLINDLLDITKLEATQEELFIEKVFVEDICQSSLSLVKAKAEEQKLGLNLVIKSDIEYFYADNQKIKQILVNLLSNAIKFTETGSVTLKVERNLDNIEFSVIDTGIGIKKSYQKKIFEPFCQLNTHLHSKNKGTGLGLALSIKLAKLHGGDIVLTSEEGKGSCFTCYLPLNL